MADTLQGRVALTKRVRRHDVWAHDPANYASAWCDLLLLANDQPRVVHLRGEAVTLQRGQLAWSQLGLAQEWKRSAEWVAAFLKFCVAQEMIRVETSHRKTVITILNYDLYNDTSPATDSASVSATDSVSEPARKGKGNLEREGEAPAVLKNAPTTEEAVAWFTGQKSGYEPDEIQAAWSELTAGAVDGCWVTGRPLRPAADWRSALASELWKRRQIYGDKKNSSRGASRRGDGEPPAPVDVPALSLAEMRVN